MIRRDFSNPVGDWQQCGRGVKLVEQKYVLIIVLCALVAVICSIDRTSMSIALLPMSQQYKWDGTDKGAISSAFSWGHAITNLLGGWACFVLSPKDVLSIGVVVWSAFTVLTPWSAGCMPMLLLVRALMGLGEGVAFPTMQAIVKGWVPLEKRSRALSLIYSGHQIGSILSLLISPYLLNSGGAPLLFSVYGSLGFVWLLAWHPLVQADPQQQQLGANKDKGQLGTAGVPSLSDVPLARFCRSKAVWAIAIAHSNFGNTYSIIIAWLPTFYSEFLGLDMKHSAWCSILPWAAMAAGTLMSGYIADRLIAAKNLNTSQVRKLLQSLGCCGPAACFLYLACGPSKGSLHGAVLSMSLAMGSLGLQAGGFGSNHQDVAAARIAPILFGITSFCASMAGSVGVLVVGRVLDVFRSWSVAFFAIAGINLATAFLFQRLSSSDLQFE
mmetsp:Transcript_1686/g.4204  ORF Transcript_1686/g.4204 Transcript_1686/m.4204 type:complete len:441 (+) Transcript_1686:79-1401(+)